MTETHSVTRAVNEIASGKPFDEPTYHLWRRYFVALHRFATRQLGLDFHTAEDVAASAFSKTMAQIKANSLQFADRGKFCGYLYRALRNGAKSLHAKNHADKRDAQEISLESLRESAVSSQPDPQTYAELLDTLEQMMSKLSGDDRAVVLRLISGEQVFQGSTISRAKRHKAYIRDVVRSALRDLGVEVETKKGRPSREAGGELLSGTQTEELDSPGAILYDFILGTTDSDPSLD